MHECGADKNLLTPHYLPNLPPHLEQSVGGLLLELWAGHLLRQAERGLVELHLVLLDQREALLLVKGGAAVNGVRAARVHLGVRGVGDGRGGQGGGDTIVGTAASIQSADKLRARSRM